MNARTCLDLVTILVNGYDLSENQYAFTGKRLDPESGLYHFHFRQYDAEVGVWTTPDPIGILSGINLYEYVQNNPPNAVDLLGLVMSAGELGVGNPGSYGGENTSQSMHGDNGRGTGNDYDSGGGVESVFDRFLMDATSALNPFFADVDYLLTSSPAPARATLNAAFGLEGFLFGYGIAGPVSSIAKAASYTSLANPEATVMAYQGMIDFTNSLLPGVPVITTKAGQAGAVISVAQWVWDSAINPLYEDVKSVFEQNDTCQK